MARQAIVSGFQFPVYVNETGNRQAISAGAAYLNETSGQAPAVVYGWETTWLQPQHPRPERSGSLARGDDGTQQRLAAFVPAAWDLPAAVQRRRQGQPFDQPSTIVVPPPFASLDWAPALHLSRLRRVLVPANEAALNAYPWTPASWEQVPQPLRAALRRQSEEFRVPLSAPALPPIQVVWLDDPQYMVWRGRWPRTAALAGGDDGAEAPLAAFIPWLALTRSRALFLVRTGTV